MIPGWLRAVGTIRVGRLTAEVRGLRRAVEALVELKALELGVPSPLGTGLQSLRREEPPVVGIVDVPAGAYVDAEHRRAAYRASAGKEAPFDEDFLSPPAEDVQGDAAARGRSTTVYPEDRPGFGDATGWRDR